MPRANRYFVPGQVWHITHRCHKKEFLLKFERDRKRWLFWLYEAKKRYGLCVLNYIVTSNHIHLLVKDTGNDVIPYSMQLIAGRVAQEYNVRKDRKGAFWEDRYHATAIDTDEYLMRCLIYIDLNMVRAGIVKHPAEWAASGYGEIQNQPSRYKIIDTAAWLDLLGFSDLSRFQEEHRQWLETTIKADSNKREAKWSESLAVGNYDFVEHIKEVLGARAKARDLTKEAAGYAVKELTIPYNTDFDPKMGLLSPKNTYNWAEI